MIVYNGIEIRNVILNGERIRGNVFVNGVQVYEQPRCSFETVIDGKPYRVDLCSVEDWYSYYFSNVGEEL